MADNVGETVPENAQDLTIFVQNLLEQMVRLTRRYKCSNVNSEGPTALGQSEITLLWKATSFISVLKICMIITAIESIRTDFTLNVVSICKIEFLPV